MLLKMELLKMELLKTEHSLGWILLTFLVCRCSTFRFFLSSACTMVLVKAVSFAKTTNFFSYPDDSFPSWVNIPACNFLPILNSLTPCAHMVFGSYCPAWKPWLNYGMVVVAVFTHPISRCWTAAVGKGIASSCPVHLSAQNLGYYFRCHRDFLFFLFSAFGWSHVNRSTWFRDLLFLLANAFAT